MRCTRAQIVAGLEAQGLRFRTFTIAHTSPHAIDDWDWNQRDISHIPFIHGGFSAGPCVAEDGIATTIYVQRVLGVRVPMAVTFHHADDAPLSRVYEAALGPLAVVVGADLAPHAGGTRVTTVYSVGCLPAARLLLPLAERVLRRNYQRVHDEDVPLRARRAELRGWGYRFVAEGGSYGRSLDLGRSNVIAPPGEAAAARVAIGDGRREVRVGRDDHLGLRVVVARDEERVRVYPRMCMHEGASLDACVESGRALRCPWHGRRVEPLATFDRGARAPEVCVTAHHRLELAGGELSIAPR
jgi:hypothetical protein